MAGCATPPPEDGAAPGQNGNDPYESFNRSMLDFNLALDKAILKPVAFVYKEGVPQPLRTNVYNFLENLRAPVIFANDLMQGELDRAGTTLLRFGMNSTLGLLGINDFATEAGIPKHDEDFGQTLAVWEVEPGAYLVLPIFGPSNPRDATGLVVDTLIDPVTWLTPFEFRLGRAVATAVDRRARRYDQINDLEKNSLDFYSAVKSLYRQRRVDEIRNGASSAVSPTPGRLSVEPEPVGPDQQTEVANPDK